MGNLEFNGEGLTRDHDGRIGTERKLICLDRHSVELEPSPFNDDFLQARLTQNEGSEREFAHLRQERLGIEVQSGFAGTFAVWAMRKMGACPARLPEEQRFFALQAMKGTKCAVRHPVDVAGHTVTAPGGGYFQSGPVAPGTKGRWARRARLGRRISVL